MELRAALTTNWPLKLTALALSVLLWLLTSSAEPASSLRSVRVQVQPPPGRTLARAPDPLRATVVGSRRDLLRLATGGLVLTRILPDTLTADSVQLDVAPIDVLLPRDASVRVQDLEPRRISVELNPVARRLVPVHPVVQVAPDSGYELAGGVAVVPDEVRLAGPRERLRLIDSVMTLPFDVSRADGPSEEHIPIDTAGLGPVRVFPARVTIKLDVRRMVERTLWPVAVQLPSAIAAQLRPDRDSVAVRVRGPRARIARLTADSVVVTVGPVADDPGTPPRAALRVVAPSGISGKASPDSVGLLRRGGHG